MADSYTASLNLRKPEVGAAHDTWGGLAGLNGDLDLIDAVFLATGLGTSVGLHVGTGKVANIEGTLLVADPTDTSAAFKFDASDITTATIRTLKAPDASGTIALKEYVTPTGTVLSGYYGGTAPPGFVFLIGRSIGDSASGATERANADTEKLYTQFWNLNFSPTGGRGASAAADFAAHKSLTLPDHRGRVMAAIDRDGSNTLNDANSSTRGAWLGVWGRDFGVTVGGTLGGTAFTNGLGGTAFTNGLATTQGTNSTYGCQGGPSIMSEQSHSHAVQGNAGISVSGNAGASVSGSLGGATDVRSIVQPTIMVDVIIAL